MRCPRSLIAEERGSITVPAVLLLFVLLGFCALVLDVGLIYAHRRSLQNAADAAALAGAREVERSLLGGAGNPAGLAETFAASNGVPAAYGDCNGGAGSLIVNQAGGLPHSWEVETSRTVPLIFGRVLGRTSQCVRARALATVVEIQFVKIWPFGILRNTARPRGQSIVLKEGSGAAEQGNFGLVDFSCGGGGTPSYEYWAFHGYGTRTGETVPVRVPPSTWTICTETGNKASVNRDLRQHVIDERQAGCLYGEPDMRCALIGLVPILSETSWPNGQKAVQVIDFDIFTIEEVTVGPGGNGKTQILGRFLQMAGGVGPTYPPNPDGSLRGAIGVRLWQ